MARPIFYHMKKVVKQKNDLMRLTGLVAVIVCLLFIVIKGIAFTVTDSISVLSSLFDSIQDLLTSGISLVAIRRSTEPPDKNHRFGHGKAQAVGAMIQSFIIFAAALILLKESLFRLFNPQPITKVGEGVILMSVTLVVTILLVLLQKYTVSKTSALAVRADLAHYSGDIIMNIGVICALIGGTWYGWHWVDGTFGIFVSCYLFTSVYFIVRDSCGMLMDEEMPHAFRKDVRQTVLSFKEVRKMADLRTRLSGSCVFIQLCIRLNSGYSLKKVHSITEMIEKEIKKKYPEAQIIIHVEPMRSKRVNDIIQSGRNS